MSNPVINQVVFAANIKGVVVVEEVDIASGTIKNGVSNAAIGSNGQTCKTGINIHGLVTQNATTYVVMTSAGPARTSLGVSTAGSNPSGLVWTIYGQPTNGQQTVLWGPGAPPPNFSLTVNSDGSLQLTPN